MVTLRPLTSNDLHFLLEVRNDPSTRHFLEDDNEFTLNGTGLNTDFSTEISLSSLLYFHYL